MAAPLSTPVASRAPGPAVYETTTAPVVARALLPYTLVGVYFGVVLTKSEVISWYRIQEMFRFQSFRMYGIIGGALLVAMASLEYIKRRHVMTFSGEPIVIPRKEMGRGYRYWIGGTLFGMGWALTGACPGPLFALLGNGVTVMAVAIVSAMGGTWAYGLLRSRLPH